MKTVIIQILTQSLLLFSNSCQHWRTDYSGFTTSATCNETLQRMQLAQCQPWSRLICARSPHPLKSGLSTSADGGYTSQKNLYQHRGRLSYPGEKLNSVLALRFSFGKLLLMFPDFLVVTQKRECFIWVWQSDSDLQHMWLFTNTNCGICTITFTRMDHFGTTF